MLYTRCWHTVAKISRLPSAGGPFALAQILLAIALPVSLRGWALSFSVLTPRRLVAWSARLRWAQLEPEFVSPAANGVTAVGLCVITIPHRLCLTRLSPTWENRWWFPQILLAIALSVSRRGWKLSFFPSWHPDCSWRGRFDSDRRNWNQNLALLQRGKDDTVFKCQAKATGQNSYAPAHFGNWCERLRVWKVLEIGTSSLSHSKKLNWNEKLPITA